MTRYYFIVASQDFLFYQEPVEEIIRERTNHYNSLKKEIDFCMTANLDFLSIYDLGFIQKKLIKPSVAIISLNPNFINWLKLRIQYGIKGTFVSSADNEYHDLFLSEKSTIV